MTINRTVIIFALALASAARAGAQPPPPPPPPDVFTMQVEPGMAMNQGIGPGTMSWVAIEPFDAGKPVTGAPYSAEAVTEVTQTLADGNRIERRTSAKIFRDGQGRMRREQQAMAIGTMVAEAEAMMITISDPVAGTFVTLDQARKTYMRAPSPKFAFSTRGGVTSYAVEGGAAGAAVGVAGARVSGGVMAMAAGSDAPSVQTESLGARDIEGVRAEGTRTTTTIAAGAIGNQMPIEMVSERWYSPELQIVVMTRRTDPRFGETVYRLTNIVRAEPATTLFQIPSDYRQEDRKMDFHFREKPPQQ
jgi:hypothetical protein